MKDFVYIPLSLLHSKWRRWQEELQLKDYPIRSGFEFGKDRYVQQFYWEGFGIERRISYQESEQGLIVDNSLKIIDEGNSIVAFLTAWLELAVTSNKDFFFNTFLSFFRVVNGVYELKYFEVVKQINLMIMEKDLIVH